MNTPVVAFQRTSARVCGVLAATGGLCGLLGWVLGVEALAAVFTGGVTMKANAAVCLMLLGTALVVLAPERARSRWMLWAGRAMAGLAMAVGGLTLTEHLSGADFGIDQLLFREPPGALATASPGRMGPPASASFLFSGMALLLLDVRTRRGAVPSQWLALLIGMIALLPLLGYAYSIQSLFGVAKYTGIALHTALAIAALAVGLLASRPTAGLMARVSADDAGGEMARRLVVPAILAPFVLGWLRTVGERAGLFDAAFGRPVLILSLIATLAWLVWWNAGALSRLGRERSRAEAGLRESEQRARLLVDAARQLGSSLDPQAIYARLRETVRGAMPLGGLVVSSYDASDGFVRCAYAWLSGNALDPASLPPLRFNPAGGGMQTQVIRTGKPLLFNDVAERVKDPRGTFYEVNPDGSMRDLRKTGPANVRSAIMVPLLSEGAVVGVVQVMSNAEHAYTNGDLALLEGIALQLGVALENARLYRRAREELEERERVEVRLREAKETAEAASRAKGEFLATLSHELRTPLTPVLLTVSLMEAHPDLPDDLRADVATVRRNVELESRLISDLLDLTRIERGKLQLDEQDVDLHLIVRSAIDICQREASAKLSVDLAAARFTVRGDATRLQQVFWNLINNAIKFTPGDGAITVRSRDADDGRVRVEVTDTGAGIDPAVLPRLFSAFEQGEVRAARQQAGLGLGLAISKRLAEAHGGTITVASEGRGRGATFAVALPTVARFVPAAAVPARPAPLRPAPRALSVLVVEDNAPTLHVLQRLLRQIGHRVTGATSVASAVAAAARDPFDLIISDLGLPDGSGLDVIRRLRADYAGRAIALTGYGMDADVAASRAAGFVEHLTKPVDLAQLEAAIRRVTPADSEG